MGRISDWISSLLSKSSTDLSKSSTDSASELQSEAEHGNAETQYCLAWDYDTHGHSTEAVRWYRKAADQGVANAQYELGYHYFTGLGVPQNYILAHMWFNLAASSEYMIRPDQQKEAVGKRDLVASKMTPAQLAEAQKLAREWKPKKEN